MTSQTRKKWLEKLTGLDLVWPAPISEADLRQLLANGNQKPSPGPDDTKAWLQKLIWRH
jgi:hypothetical protein